MVVEVSELAPSNKKSAIRVLHVDDDLCFLEVSKQILSMENNFEIDNAASVGEAFKKMEQQPYDAVVSDYEMPQKNGLEFLKEIKEKNSQIPFILFTGKGREDVAVKALNLGADSYINKNGSPETVYCELADAINKTIERKKSKKALAESELKYRIMVEKSLQGILITQTSPIRLVFANASMSEILGYSTEELKSLSPEGVAGLIYSEDRTVFFKRLESRMLGEPAPSSLEFRAVRKNGSIVWLAAFANRIDYMGQPAVQGMFLDISERKKADQILKENEARYRELADSLPDIVFEIDLNGKLTFFNQRAFEITGYTREDFEKGLNIFQLATSEDIQRGLENMQKSLTGKTHTPTECTITRKNGTAFTGLIRASPRISENKVMGLRAIVIDITERKKNDLEIKQKNEALESVAESIDSGLAVISKDYSVVWANKYLMDLGVAPNKKCYQTFNSSETVCPDCGAKKVFEQNASLDVHEFKTVNSKGETVWIELRVTPLKDKDGNVTAALELAVPITERKKAEELQKVLERKVNDYSKHLKCMVDLRTVQLKDVNERLVKSERLAAIGELAGMVGHDLRNPLAGIKNAAYYLKKKGTTISEAQSKEMLEIIEKAIDHSDKIINDLLDYSREMHLELTESAPRTLLEEAVRMIQVPDRIHILNYAHEETKVKVDADKMMRVFINLIKNAIDAMPEKGTLEISSCQTKDCMEIAFADTGTGIPEETLRKIFSPLFTTKAQGMGFGLAICKRIIEAHGGTITVETAVNKGTTFTITLPLKPKVKVEGEKTWVTMPESMSMMMKTKT